MSPFGNNIEGIIIKFTLGACFVGIITIFGIKMLILLGTVAKIKLLGVLEGYEMLSKVAEGIFSVKGMFGK